MKIIQKQINKKQMKYLHYKTYLSMIDKCENLEIFRNFFAEDDNGEIKDLLDDSDNSCASFVSNILYINGLIQSPRATVDSTERDILNFGWIESNDIKTIEKGDLIIWPKDKEHNNRHFGIYLGNNQCIQNDPILRKTTIKELNFRPIEKIFKYIKKDE